VNMRLALAIAVMPCLAAAGGCAATPPSAGTSLARPGVSDPDSQSQSARLIRELEVAKGEKTILECRLAEQIRRETRLSDEVNRLRSLTDAQDSQIKALANAVRQRDELLERCSLLEAQIALLKSRLA
jgi:hypothetical protein